MKTLADLVESFNIKDSNFTALKVKKESDSVLYSFRDLYDEIMKLSSFFIDIGIEKGEKLAIFSDNRLEWLICDLACQYIGVVDVPRGSNISENEIYYIMNHSEINYSIFENKSVFEKYKKIAETVPAQNKIIVLDEKDISMGEGFDIISFQEALKIGDSSFGLTESKINDFKNKISENDLATVIYTSGTTGLPKGVMLTHSNIISNVLRLPEMIGIKSGDIALSILPTWHVYERTVEYIILSARATLVYSKPFPSVLLKDFAEENPQFLPSVPRVWEGVYEGILKNIMKQGKVIYSLFKFFYALTNVRFKTYMNFTGLRPVLTKRDDYIRKGSYPFNVLLYLLLTPFYLLGNLLIFRKIKAKLGNAFKAGVSGGGGLPRIVDDFFNSLGVSVLEGYGLTETSPIICVRDYRHPVFHTIGDIIPDTEVQIRDQDDNELGYGQKGIIWVKGPQVMKGYYKQDDVTANVLKDGWFNTGDIGIMDINKRIKITGRAKTTIVLRGGENVEPEPIEEKLKESRYIKNAVVLGQDKKRLGVLIIPDLENLAEHFGKKITERGFDSSKLINSNDVNLFFRDIVQKSINIKSGFKRYEIIGSIGYLENDFEPGVELTHSLKLRRNIIEDKYKKIIEKLFIND